ncbi:hypothetical protein [Sphingomonas sp. CFBP 13720]|uniref:hypothetical protein n=1 Tax=Sphingomonas sp. CFBP 13720 TaxID=2775302 RepID=UPI00177F7733|nr:hypothetical protein [Sphingomonas sp. CFBP 13720]MBD8679266.1 hypothetical protein [Sphingomonas sp. CFBP 13720]
MNKKQFLPLQDTVGDRAKSDDLDSRIRELFLRLDYANWVEKVESGEWRPCNRRASPEDWQRLAIALAFKHGEPGFEMYLRPFTKRSPAEDDQIERDELMLHYMNLDVHPKNGNKMNIRSAAKLVAEDLAKLDRTRRAKILSENGDATEFEPSEIDSESIRTQFSKRKTAAEKQGLEFEPELPSYLRLFVASNNLFNALLRSAKNLSE